MQRPTAENKQKLITLSKNVATTMTEIIQAAEAIKGASVCGARSQRVTNCCVWVDERN